MEQSGTYLYGLDLYNYAYWWECHEQVEALWHPVGHHTRQGQFLQGIVQIAAANLHKFMGAADLGDEGRSLADKGPTRLAEFSQIYMGVDVPRFRRDVQAYFNDSRPQPALTTLYGQILSHRVEC